MLSFDFFCKGKAGLNYSKGFGSFFDRFHTNPQIFIRQGLRRWSRAATRIIFFCRSQDNFINRDIINNTLVGINDIEDYFGFDDAVFLNLEKMD